jgi:hypothetical protein
MHTLQPLKSGGEKFECTDEYGVGNYCVTNTYRVSEVRATSLPHCRWLCGYAARGTWWGYFQLTKLNASSNRHRPQSRRHSMCTLADIGINLRVLNLDSRVTWCVLKQLQEWRCLQTCARFSQQNFNIFLIEPGEGSWHTQQAAGWRIGVGITGNAVGQASQYK